METNEFFDLLKDYSDNIRQSSQDDSYYLSDLNIIRTPSSNNIYLAQITAENHVTARGKKRVLTFVYTFEVVQEGEITMSRDVLIDHIHAGEDLKSIDLTRGINLDEIVDL